MGPKKKKTKLPANKLRGFATTSIPKAQPKVEDSSPQETLAAADEQPTTATEEQVEELIEVTTPQDHEDCELARLAKRFSDIDRQKVDSYFKHLTNVEGLDNSISSIILNSKIEHKILELLKHCQCPLEFDGIPTSSILPAERDRVLSILDVIYITLQRMGFEASLIEKAMQTTSSLRLTDILDWLCLMLPDDCLPKGFVDKTYYKEELSISTVLNKISSQSSIVQDSHQIVPNDGKTLMSTVSQVVSVSHKNVPTNIKSWILSHIDNDEDVKNDGPTASEVTNPNQTYAALKLATINHQRRLAAAKKAGDVESIESLPVEIEAIKNQMKALEIDFDFDRRNAERLFLDLQRTQPYDSPPMTIPVSVESITREPESDSGSDSDHDTSLFGGLLDEPTTTAPSLPSATSIATLVVRSLNTPNWVGMSPKDVLFDHVKSQKPQPKITYCKLTAPPGYHRAGVYIQLKGKDAGSFEMPTTEACPTYKEAENYAATLALFNLTSLPLYRSLPPEYKNLWLSWIATQEDKLRKKEFDDVKMRFRFLIGIVNHEGTSIPKKACQFFVACRARNTAASTSEASSATTSEVIAPAMENEPTAAGLRMRRQFQQRQESEKYRSLLTKRRQLPIHGYRSELLNLIEKNQVLVISGETGCGKSTQVPQYIVENLMLSGFGDCCNVVCTQPRRISCISIAHRVGLELADPPRSTGSPRSLVGYNIRLESRVSPENVLVFCTTGILLRRLENDPYLTGVTHVIVDEVHERTLEGDFLLIVLRKLISIRKDLRIVLMSATVDAQKFADYFDGCPVIDVPGRTFPVEVKFLEDIIEQTGYILEEDSEYAKRPSRLKRDEGTVRISGKHGATETVRLTWEEDLYNSYDPDVQDDLTSDSAVIGLSARTLKILSRIDETKTNYDIILALLENILFGSFDAVPEGAILVFLPGMPEIRRLHDLLMADQRFSDESSFLIWPLHSVISSEGQEAVFDTPPEGVRKIVLATNIAETGITIPDCTIVIDTGKVKQVRYDEKRKITRLQEVFVSKANAHQRRGRAGRVREGICFHLFSKRYYDCEMADFQPPEITRLALYELCLKIKACNLGNIAEVLAMAIDAPPAMAVANAIETLREIQAITDDEQLTPLGAHLSRLPLDVHIGKMILFGAIFQCLDPVLTIAAALSFKSPFVRPFGKEHEADIAREKFKAGNSDFLLIWKAYRLWRDELIQRPSNVTEFCRRHFLSHANLVTIENMKSQFLGLLAEIGFVRLSGESEVELSRYNYNRNDMTICKIPERYDVFSNNASVIGAAITAGLYPKVAYRSPMVKHLVTGAKQDPAYIHPSSINFSRSENRVLPTAWFVYSTIVQTNRIYLWETHQNDSLYPLLLFSRDFVIKHESKHIIIDKWIKMNCPAKTAVVFKCLRNALNQMLTRMIREPASELTLDEQKWMELMVEVLTPEA